VSQAGSPLSAPAPGGEGTKYDTGKPRLDLVPPELILAVGMIMGYGAEKYAEHNWWKGMDHGRLLAAALRHLMAHELGEDYDSESGMLHLAHAATNIAFLIAFVLNGKGHDNRRPK
jgi:dATP/dGTP diphosphohydrolase, N-terminal